MKIPKEYKKLTPDIIEQFLLDLEKHQRDTRECKFVTGKLGAVNYLESLDRTSGMEEEQIIARKEYNLKTIPNGCYLITKNGIQKYGN